MAVVSLVSVAGVLLFLCLRRENFSMPNLPKPLRREMSSTNVQNCIKGDKNSCVTINTNQYGSSKKEASDGYDICKEKAAEMLKKVKGNVDTLGNFICAGQALSGSLGKV